MPETSGQHCLLGGLLAAATEVKQHFAAVCAYDNSWSKGRIVFAR